MSRRLIARPCTDALSIRANMTNEQASVALRPLALHTLPDYCALLVSGSNPVTITVGFFTPSQERNDALMVQLRHVLAVREVLE